MIDHLDDDSTARKILKTEVFEDFEVAKNIKSETKEERLKYRINPPEVEN